jgi:hypothetical protein
VVLGLQIGSWKEEQPAVKSKASTKYFIVDPFD